MFRTGNPILKGEVFAAPRGWAAMVASRPEGAVRVMTLNGTITATAILVGICASAAVAVWPVLTANPSWAFPAWLASVVVGLALGVSIHWNNRAAPYLAPLGAAAEGVFCSVFSMLVVKWYKGADLGAGLILQAMLLTMGILAAMLLAYRTGLIKATGRFWACVVSATGGIMIYYLAAFVLNGLLGMSVPILGWGWRVDAVGIGFSVAVVVLASLNLVLDFEYVRFGVHNKLPKHMEWYAGYALLVTLVWLYIEVLRLLAKLRR